MKRNASSNLIFKSNSLDPFPFVRIVIWMLNFELRIIEKVERMNVRMRRHCLCGDIVILWYLIGTLRFMLDVWCFSTETHITFLDEIKLNPVLGMVHTYAHFEFPKKWIDHKIIMKCKLTHQRDQPNMKCRNRITTNVDFLPSSAMFTIWKCWCVWL